MKALLAKKINIKNGKDKEKITATKTEERKKKSLEKENKELIIGRRAW
jgi:hypothetical protein